MHSHRSSPLFAEASSVMDSQVKEQKTKLRFSEIFRCLFYAVVVAFLLSCMVFQAFLYMDHLEMKQRLAAIDEEINTLKLTSKTLLTSPTQAVSRDALHDVQGLHGRLRRASTVSLQNLEKRLKILEIW